MSEGFNKNMEEYNIEINNDFVEDKDGELRNLYDTFLANCKHISDSSNRYNTNDTSAETVIKLQLEAMYKMMNEGVARIKLHDAYMRYSQWKEVDQEK